MEIEILHALAPFAWPVVTLILTCLAFFVVYKKISIRSFKIKIGDKEVQVETFLPALAQQVAAMAREPADTANGNTPLKEKQELNTSSPTKRITKRTSAILWVDDNPHRNANIVENLEEAGVLIKEVTSTQQALNTMAAEDFAAIITDMIRMEPGIDRHHAGIELIRKVRKINKDIPIFIYTSGNQKREYGQKAIDEGATNITTSASNLIKMLRSVGIEIN